MQCFRCLASCILCRDRVRFRLRGLCGGSRDVASLGIQSQSWHRSGETDHFVTFVPSTVGVQSNFQPTRGAASAVGYVICRAAPLLPRRHGCRRLSGVEPSTASCELERASDESIAQAGWSGLVRDHGKGRIPLPAMTSADVVAAPPHTWLVYLELKWLRLVLGIISRIVV